MFPRSSLKPFQFLWFSSVVSSASALLREAGRQADKSNASVLAAIGRGLSESQAEAEGRKNLDGWRRLLGRWAALPLVLRASAWVAHWISALEAHRHEAEGRRPASPYSRTRIAWSHRCSRRQPRLYGYSTSPHGYIPRAGGRTPRSFAPGPHLISSEGLATAAGERCLDESHAGFAARSMTASSHQ